MGFWVRGVHHHAWLKAFLSTVFSALARVKILLFKTSVQENYAPVGTQTTARWNPTALGEAVVLSATMGG